MLSRIPSDHWYCYQQRIHLPSPTSEEQINAFLEKVKADTSLQEKLKAAGSNEAAIEIAKEAGFAITTEDIQSMQPATVELSDEELDGAAGGIRVLNIFSDMQ